MYILSSFNITHNKVDVDIGIDSEKPNERKQKSMTSVWREHCSAISLSAIANIMEKQPSKVRRSLDTT